MPKSTTLILVASLVATSSARAQTHLPLLGDDVALEDFGVAAARDIVHGRVAVVNDPEGPRLVVHFLRTTPPPAPPPPPPTTPEGDDVSGPPDRTTVGEALTALWVWETAEILADAGERAALLDLVEREGIDRIFLYVPAGSGAAPRAGFVPFDGAEVGPLVAELRTRGALTYALDGDPDYVHTENHAGVLRTVTRVVAHNRSAPLEQRFHGVRYDIEPYLLPGFQGPRREQILSDYLRLISDASVVAREGGLAFGVDVPFWLDGRDEITGEPFEATLDGERASVLTHLVELVDDFAIMAYRTFSAGPDGVLAHSGGELARAREPGVGVFVGVETTQIHDEQLYTLRSRGRPGLPPDPEIPWIVAQELEGGLVRIWFVDGPAARADLEAAVSGTGSLTYWFAGEALQVPGSRISFHRLGLSAMRQVTGELLEGLGRHPAFRGLAFHDYHGLKALLDAR